MPRPKKERIVCLDPNVKCFGPQWANSTNETIEIFCDEIESIKLINLEGLNMAEWWKKMGVSAATFNSKICIQEITDAIINGKNLAVKM